MNFEDLIDPYMLKQLKRVKKLIRTEDEDFVIVVEGDERIGKSTLALIICLFLDPNFKIDQVVFKKKFFVKVIRKLRKFGALLYDEAGLGLYKRDASTRGTKVINKILMTVGQRNLILVFCIPSYKELDPYLRTHRVNVLIRVVEKGYAKVYSKSKIKRIQHFKDGTIKYPVCEFAVHFKKLEGEIWDEYKKHKQKQLADYLKEIDERDQTEGKISLFDLVIEWSKRYPELPPKLFIEANPGVNPNSVYNIRNKNRHLWDPQLIK